MSFRGDRSVLGPPAYSSYSVRTQEGDPLNERPERYEDWSRGIGDGRDFIPGGVHYATGVHLPKGRIALGPRVRTLNLANDDAADEVLDLESGGRFLWSGAGSRVFRIDLADDGVTSSAQQAASVLSLQTWRGAMFAAIEGANAYVVNPASNVTAGTHAWAANASNDEANAFGISRTSGKGPSLVRGRENKWSRFVPTDTTGIPGIWGVEYAIGGDAAIAQLRSHNYSDYILKADGLYSFGDATEEGNNLLGDLEIFPSAENRWMTIWHNTLLVCSAVGLFRVFGGVQRMTGIEECELNTVAYGNPTAAIGFGRLFYEARNLGTKTVIIQYRLSRGRETSLDAPFTPVAIVDVFEGSCKAMAITAYAGETRLWYGAGGDLRYLKLTIDGTPAEVTAAAAFSANTADSIEDASPTVALSPTYFGSTDTVKYLRKVELSMEGTGQVRLDVAGQQLEADAGDGHVELFSAKRCRGPAALRSRAQAAQRRPRGPEHDLLLRGAAGGGVRLPLRAAAAKRCGPARAHEARRGEGAAGQRADHIRRPRWGGPQGVPRTVRG